MATTNLSCAVCKKNFSKHFNLRAHVQKFHKDKLEELAPKKIQYPICDVCKKTFVKYSNLAKHIKTFHKDKQDELLKPPRSYNYSCDVCQKNFTHLRHFKSHKKCHLEQNSSGLKCILCDNSNLVCFKKSDLFKHFQDRHDINMVTVMFEFGSSEEFKNWKKQEERKTNELFVNHHGTYQGDNHNTTKYVCHRSGHYKCVGSGARRLKTQGSKKINGFCPAEMRVKTINEKCEVQYVKTHIGHSNDLRHLYLTKTEQHEDIDINHDNTQLAEYLAYDEEVCKEEKLQIVGALSKNTIIDEAKFSLEKKNLKHELLQTINGITCFEELDVVKNMLAPLQSTLTVMRTLKREDLEK